MLFKHPSVLSRLGYSDVDIKYTEDDIIKMREFQKVDNIFMIFVETFFHKIVYIPMDTNYTHLDSVLCINNPDFNNYLDQMYHVELEI